MADKIKKPIVTFTGEDGNIFGLISRAYYALKKVGLKKQANDMRQKAMVTGSVQKSIIIIRKYVQLKKGSIDRQGAKHIEKDQD
jgi:hypothetical protein